LMKRASQLKVTKSGKSVGLATVRFDKTVKKKLINHLNVAG
jgi:hypothetical protein